MERGSETQSGNDSATDNYFSSNPPPASLDEHKRLANPFIKYHVQSNRNVVLITSGGTTVPLENQTVRFIDNFSAGTRGATSAEYFLEAGYAVIFLHRHFSLLPYSRHYSHSTNCFLDFMTEDGKGNVVVDYDYQGEMLAVLRKYNAAKDKNRLLLLPFTTVTEYLWNLRGLAVLMRPLGPRALFYLPAAVSDFFLPKDRLSEHKIQSTEVPQPNPESYPMLSNGLSGTGQSNKLVINLDPVPKFLKVLLDGWAPEGMIVSFKLETDPSILVKKAQQALAKYSHHLVIGNLLSSRKYEVVLVTTDGEGWIRVPQHRRTRSVTQPGLSKEEAADGTKTRNMDEHGPVEIESMIVPEVTTMHQQFIKRSQEVKEADDENMLANALVWAELGAD